MVHHGISIHFQNTSCVTDTIPIHSLLIHLGFYFRHMTSIDVIFQKTLPAGIAAIPLSAVLSSAMSSIAPYVALFEAYRNPTMFHRLVFMEYFPDIQPWIQAGRFYHIHSDPNICLVHKLTCLVK